MPTASRAKNSVRFLRLLAGLVLLLANLSGQCSPPDLAGGQTAAGIVGTRFIDINVCLFDPRGRSGDLTNYMKDLDLAARQWGVRAHSRTYVDELTAVEDFKSAQCDIIVLTTARARQFNAFVASFDAVGGLENYGQLRSAIEGLLKSAKLAPLLTHGKFEVAAVLPVGGVYLLTRDRRLDSLHSMPSRHIAVLDWDTSTIELMRSLGAHVVSADLSNYGGLFDSGQVEAMTAPALAFQPMELNRGVEPRGAVVHFPLVMMTGTIIVNRDMLAAKATDYEARIARLRQYILAQLDPAFAIIDRAEKDIPGADWADLNEAATADERNILLEERVQLTHDGFYDPRMTHFLKRIRCHSEPSHAECFDQRE